MHVSFLLPAFLLLTLVGCQPSKTRFERLAADKTGVTFANTITESDRQADLSLNVMDFEYIYNGGGVGVGDFDGDGQPDLFFAANQVSSRLYLNKGQFRFQDVTEAAGVATHVWCTGVAVTDINQDGRQDIYVATICPRRDCAVRNLLYINQGNDADGVPRFSEQAQAAGLADSSYTTQATFLDYDRDGDLDMFLLTNALESYNRNNVTGPNNSGSARSCDKLFRNDGPVKQLGKSKNAPLPHFTDVSAQAGLMHEGWGLGVVVNDVNQDGWPDVYVANDFQSNDVWLVNNRHGGFTNRIADALKHQSHNSMGADIADINNDGLNDLVVVDMLPDDNLRQKTMFGTIPYDRFQMARRMGYQPQYIRNVLQLNRGFGPNPADTAMPHFSDVGYLAGVAATDWSWSALFADFDNDGFRDLLITNGYRKDITDLDFTSYNREGGTFGSDADRRTGLLKRIDALEPVYKPNFLFHNGGAHGADPPEFTNVAAEWGLTEPSFTNGTAYADFDGDGDLDIVMNNINDPAFIYKNRTIDLDTQPDSAHFLRIQLRGKPGNNEGVGAKLAVWTGADRHYLEHTRQRGYKSTMESVLHVGLGRAARIDSIQVHWSDGTGQTIRNLAVNQLLTLDARNALLQPPGFMQWPITGPSLLTDSTLPGLTFRHEEADFVDYKMQQTLLAHKHSQIGPGLAVGDVDGNGLDDVYVAGPSGVGGTFFLQQPGKAGAGSSFIRENRPAKVPEETGGLLFDADNDGDLDLYAVHGSTEFGKDTRMYQDSLYLNEGLVNEPFTHQKKLRFRSVAQALPPITSSGSCVVAADYDRDGDLDLFVGGRVVPQRFPEPARSYILRNDSKPGAPRFTDVTAQLAPELQRAGLICAALWTDVDNDTWPDLLLAGEFMPITLLRNNHGRRLTQATCPPNRPDCALSMAVGFWNSLTPGDFDHDGDTDFIAGNMGLNTRYKASASQPISVYAADFDQNGTLDPILSAFNGNTEYPVHPRDVLTDQVPIFKKKMTTYAAYGAQKLTDVLTDEQRQQAQIHQATYAASAYVENRNGTLVLHELPRQAQLSPTFGTVATDINHDGHLDVLLVGNDYSTEVLSGWQDAGLGLCLLGDGHGHFRALTPAQAGFVVDGDAKALATLLLANGQLAYVATQNNGPLRVFTERKPALYQKLVTASQSLNKTSWGGGYLSQSSRVRVAGQIHK